MTSTESKGYKAYYLGQGISNNPYQGNDRREWARGWWAAYNYHRR